MNDSYLNNLSGRGCEIQGCKEKRNQLLRNTRENDIYPRQILKSKKKNDFIRKNVQRWSKQSHDQMLSQNICIWYSIELKTRFDSFLTSLTQN